MAADEIVESWRCFPVEALIDLKVCPVDPYSVNFEKCFSTRRSRYGSLSYSNASRFTGGDYYRFQELSPRVRDPAAIVLLVPCVTVSESIYGVVF
jgi:hypothetical protein